MLLFLVISLHLLRLGELLSTRYAGADRSSDVPIDDNGINSEAVGNETVWRNEATTEGNEVLPAIVANLVASFHLEEFTIRGVSRLGSRIYILVQEVHAPPPYSSSHPTPKIVVFEEVYGIEFNLKEEYHLKNIQYPRDIVYSEVERCFYILDESYSITRGTMTRSCIWKVTEEDGENQEKKVVVVKWLEFGDQDMAQTFSPTRDGQLLIANWGKNELQIYGGSRHADLSRSVPFPEGVSQPVHAVETPQGNFVVLHIIDKPKREKRSAESSGSGETGPDWECDTRSEITWLFVVSELSRDGKTLIRRFVPQTEEQELHDPGYLVVDSLGRVLVGEDWNFVAGNYRVILLDAELRWNGVLIPTTEEAKERGKSPIPWPERMFLDERNKQLIIGGRGFRTGAAFYTLEIE